MMEIIEKTLQVPILKSTINIDEEVLQKYIKEIYRVGDEVYQQTNVKADMSFYNLHQKNRLLSKLADLIVNYIYDNFPCELFINEIDGGKTKKEHFLKLRDFWSAIYKEGDYTIRHIHNDNDISFCFYLQANEKSSPLYFDDLDFKIQPQKNLLVAFPSFLSHSVEKQIKSEKDRIIVSGNLKYRFRKEEQFVVKKNIY